VHTRPADLVVLGGRVFSPGRASAVAVRDGRITAVGGDDEVRTLAGPRTEVVEARGGLVHAGFVDAHVHPVQAGLERMRCDLSAGRTATEYVRLVADYAAAHPEQSWIAGAGWAMAAFPGGAPRAELLDAVVPDRPVFLPNRDHHGAWVNSRALELAGIDKRTPDPHDGRIERDADGRPTGTLHEGAMHLVGDLRPQDTPAEMLAALLGAQGYLHSLGITGWQDAIVGHHANLLDTSGTYRDASDRGLLTARVVGALFWDRHRGAEQIEDLLARRELMTGPRLSAGTVKIMQDGVPENFTAGMTEPYLDACGCRTANAGLSFLDPTALAEHVVELERHGFQVHVHAIGDRAVRETLDAFAAGRRANGRHDLRHHIAHAQVVHPDDVPRFAELGVAVNMQTLWAANDPQMLDLNVPFLGPERARWQYPFGDLARTGARLCAGSDWPVTSADPWDALHVAVNRHLPAHLVDRDYEPFLPEQALDLATALTAYTAGSAWINHADDTGRIEVGAQADLVVADRDPFPGPAEEIAATEVVATYVGGRLVHPA
jgi:predicted amidohydrolase YtcJ